MCLEEVKIAREKASRMKSIWEGEEVRSIFDSVSPIMSRRWEVVRGRVMEERGIG